MSRTSAAAAAAVLALAAAVCTGCAGPAASSPAGERSTGEPPAGATATPDAASGGDDERGDDERGDDEREEPRAAAFAAALGAPVRARDDGSFGLDRWSELAPEETGPGRPGVRVDFPAGSVSPSATREHGSPEGGLQAFLPLHDGPLDAAHLRYWVRFPPAFEFVKGGKLPGLYGGTEVSGGEEPDGTDGFSTRLMWRREGAGEVYLYALDESGTSLGRGSWTWPTGSWVCVEQRVVLNEPGEGDGSVTVWLDGREVHREAGMELRTVPDLRIEGIFFSTFYGGADPSWAPARDQHADFAGLAVGPDPIGCAAS